MIVLHGKERETCVEERKGGEKSGGMRGRVWTYVVIDGMIGLGGRKEDIVGFTYTPVFAGSYVSYLSIVR